MDKIKVEDIISEKKIFNFIKEVAVEYHQSQLQVLKEEIQSLHNDLSHVDESNWNEAVIDALGRLRNIKTKLEE